jgi:hypothetical protein
MIIRYSYIVTLIAASTTLLASCLSLRAENLSATGNLSIAGDTDLRGPVSFGRLTEDTNAKGFNVEVSQEGHFYYTEVYVEGSWIYEPTGWVEDGHYEGQYVNVNISEWVNHPHWITDIVDEFGAIITPGYMADNYLWEYVRTESQWTNVWVVTGGHYTGANQVWKSPETISVPVQTYDAPQVRFSGTRSNTAWVWRNPSSSNPGEMRDLMALSMGGLSFPAPGDPTGTSRALLTHGSFEQSYTTPLVANTSYQSFGSKVGKNKIEVWDHVGHNNDSADTNITNSVYAVLDNKSESTLAPIGLTLSYSESLDGGSTMNTATTTVTATSANFGGAVNVNGPVTIAPQGDLAMGAFTHKP